MKILRKIENRIKLSWVKNSLKRRLLELIYTYPDEIRRNGKLIHFTKFRISGHYKDFEPLILNYQKACELKELPGGNFTFVSDSLYWSNGIVKVEVQTAEEIFILHEIWCEGCYNINLDPGRPIIVVDVGMNVGYASLFFAAKYNVKLVYSYEPFIPTYGQALVNLQLNSEISRRICPNNFGLSSKEGILSVDYSSKQRGRIGIWGTDLILEKVEKSGKENLHLKSFADEVSVIIQKHPDCEFVLKIDCEGSEYEIASQFDSIPLKNVKGVLMEWHKRGPEQLNGIFLSLGFTSLVFSPNSKTTGMLYAFK